MDLLTMNVPVLHDNFAEESNVDFDINNLEEIDINSFILAEVDKNFCLHNNIITDNVQRCLDCGLELHQELSMEPEWRNYDNDGKNDSRCHIRKDDTKNIFKDLDTYNIARDYIKDINELYHEVTNGKILRANNRKAYIYICIKEIFKYRGETLDESIDKNFIDSLNKKDISKASKEIKLCMNKEKKNMQIFNINHIEKIMTKFNAGTAHTDNVKLLYEIIKNKNTTINRSHQQSVMCGLIYYYLRIHSLRDDHYDINCDKFSNIVNLSVITINRIAKQISKILGTEDKVKL